jgi:PAS domain S-box-containing protein
MRSKTGRIKIPVDSRIPYEACFEDAPMGMTVTTMDGKVLHLNKAMLSITGYSKEESVSIDATCLYKNSQDRERFTSIIRKDKCSVSKESGQMRG